MKELRLYERRTRETEVRIELGPMEQPGAGKAAGTTIRTGRSFLDHMLETLARYAGWDLRVAATGDLKHHLIEDVAITLGDALRAQTPATCARYGWARIPMDEALVEAAVDLGGRFYYEGELPMPLYEHFLRSLADHAQATLHLRVVRGRNRHHVVEAAFKATGLSLRQALAESGAVFSTKGAVVSIQSSKGQGAKGQGAQSQGAREHGAGEHGAGEHATGEHGAGEHGAPEHGGWGQDGEGGR